MTRLFGILLLTGVWTAVVDAQATTPNWSLMIPPPLLGGPFADHEAPLSQWTILETFDSAGPCKAKRRLLVQEANHYAEAAAQALQDWHERQSVRAELREPAVHHATFKSAECVVAGDPRLARIAPTWLLLLPPPRSARPFVDDEAPLAKWGKLGPYDSHLGCQVAQRAMPEFMDLGPAPGPPDSDPRWQRDAHDKFWQRLALARSKCVQATDSRLAPTGTR